MLKISNMLKVKELSFIAAYHINIRVQMLVDNGGRINFKMVDVSYGRLILF